MHVYFRKEKKRKLIDIHLKSATTAIRQSGEKSKWTVVELQTFPRGTYVQYNQQ